MPKMTAQEAHNMLVADLLAQRLLLSALLRQVPDIRLLRRDFAEQVEDSTVRATYSTMPESFFQAFLEARDTWLEVIDAVATSG